MSGHSKWSTIKHKKAAQDSKRGQLFTKLIRQITVAVREGSADPEANFKLRLAVEKARQYNMPKANIERAIERGIASGAGEGLTEAVYEGFGPGNTAVMVAVLTDNKNRTTATVKQLFERAGGRLGQPGSVSFLFERKGRVVVEKQLETEPQILRLIDLGVEEVSEIDSGIEVLTQANQLAVTRNRLEQAGFKVKEAELFYEPKASLSLDEPVKDKAVEFLNHLDDLDDVQEVYTNLAW